MSRREQPADASFHGLREAPDTSAVTSAALQAFSGAYSDLKLQPLVVVIAAYNEADNIGPVLDEIPQQIGDVAVSLLVIDDGSADNTTEVAQRHGALVCTLAGQPRPRRGAAARLPDRPRGRRASTSRRSTATASGIRPTLPAMVQLPGVRSG